MLSNKGSLVTRFSTQRRRDAETQRNTNSKQKKWIQFLTNNLYASASLRLCVEIWVRNGTLWRNIFSSYNLLVLLILSMGGLAAEVTTVRGFLFKGENEQWVLSSEPNVKSCCVGKDSKRDKQILLEGQYDENLINQVVEVEGVIENTPYRKMKDVKLISKPREHNWIWLGLLGVGVGVVLLRRYWAK